MAAAGLPHKERSGRAAIARRTPFVSVHAHSQTRAGRGQGSPETETGVRGGRESPARSTLFPLGLLRAAGGPGRRAARGGQEARRWGRRWHGPRSATWRSPHVTAADQWRAAGAPLRLRGLGLEIQNLTLGQPSASRSELGVAGRGAPNCSFRNPEPSARRVSWSPVGTPGRAGPENGGKKPEASGAGPRRLLLPAVQGNSKVNETGPGGLRATHPHPGAWP